MAFVQLEPVLGRSILASAVKVKKEKKSEKGRDIRDMRQIIQFLNPRLRDRQARAKHQIHERMDVALLRKVGAEGGRTRVVIGGGRAGGAVARFFDVGDYVPEEGEGC